jgi:hypothetical protein
MDIPCSAYYADDDEMADVPTYAIDSIISSYIVEYPKDAPTKGPDSVPSIRPDMSSGYGVDKHLLPITTTQIYTTSPRILLPQSAPTKSNATPTFPATPAFSASYHHRHSSKDVIDVDMLDIPGLHI